MAKKEYPISEYIFSVSHKVLEKMAGRTLSDEEAELIASNVCDGLHDLVADHIDELIVDAIEESGLADD